MGCYRLESAVKQSANEFAVHAQGVVHRDIKPDNLLLTEDDVLKIVDFGVSEMFEKTSDMRTTKSAGSPAFMPPELCVAKHGDISGKAADIWSMGVSLYCLRFGRIPFERPGVLELYEAIKHDPIDFKPVDDPQFVDLMEKILEKDPQKRITMRELRVRYPCFYWNSFTNTTQNHPWVTKDGSDPLLPEEENTSDLVEPPTQSEINRAITATMNNLLTVVSFISTFSCLQSSFDIILDESSEQVQMLAVEATPGVNDWYSRSRCSDRATTITAR